MTIYYKNYFSITYFYESTQAVFTIIHFVIQNFDFLLFERKLCMRDTLNFQPNKLKFVAGSLFHKKSLSRILKTIRSKRSEYLPYKNFVKNVNFERLICEKVKNRSQTYILRIHRVTIKSIEYF